LAILKTNPRSLIYIYFLGWHSDVSYELQPPGFTFLKIDTLPGGSGGDTLWASSYAAYDRLSPEIKKTIENLQAVHSGKEQAAGAKAQGRTVRRQDTEHIHPLVRTHPVTGWKALWVQPGFTRRIVGLSRHESDALLKLLYDHLAGGYDFHVRFKWTEDAVAVWDNRVTSHAAIFDYTDFGKRHGWRITTQVMLKVA
jgi:alpha-ketoglutarate-dependent taurine dioxygenase